MTPDTTALPWSGLSPQLRAAAMVLGYSAQEWNDDGGYEEDVATLMPAVPLPVALPTAAAAGVATTSLPVGVAAVPPFPAPPPEAASQGPPGKDKATWAELTPEEMRAATTLGFDASFWENGMTPDTIALPWSGLPPQLRAAAMVLDYTASEWNLDGGFDDEAA